MRLPSDADASGRTLGEEELALLAEVIRSGTLNATRGSQTPALEREFAELLGLRHCRAVSSGTAAIHTALAALGVGPGDEVVTSPITDMGAITPIVYEGAVPVFADVDPATLAITPETLERAIGPRTRAAIVTHLFGNPCDMDGIVEVARRHGIALVEDCAQAYLATWRGRPVGTFGTIACFSLQQGKHATSGEGGLVVTDDPDLARRARLFSDKAWGYGDLQPDHTFLALNYRITELQAAVARAQIAKLPANVERRRAAAARLDAALAEIPGLEPVPVDPRARPSYWRYALRVDPARVPGGPDALARALAARGVGSAPRYVKRPAFACAVFRDPRTWARVGRKPPELGPETHPGVYEGLARVLVLPWNERYEDAHVAFLARALQEALG